MVAGITDELGLVELSVPDKRLDGSYEEPSNLVP
jgi:hypothetical protein